METALSDRTFRHRYSGTDVTFGRGTAAALGGILEELGAGRALLVCGPNLARNETLVASLVDGAAGRIASSFGAIRPHAPVADIDSAYERYQELECDGVVSVGGGSSHDAATAVALAARKGEPVSALLPTGTEAFVRLDDASDSTVPVVAVPTTLSAAETTCGVGLTDEARHRKCVLFGRALFVSHIVLDPDVFATTPLAVLLGTGMNAINHAVERLCSPSLQPIAEPGFVASAHLLVRSLPALAEHGPDDIESLSNAVLGAHLSTSVNVLGGIAHALTHQLGSRYRLDHGVLSGIVLPPCVDFVEPAVPAAVARLGEVLNQATGGTPATGAAPLLRALVERLGQPARLRDVDVPRDELPSVAEAVLEDISIRNSARPVSDVAEVAALLDACW